MPMCNLYRLRTGKAEIAHIFGAEVPVGTNIPAEEVLPNYPGLVTNGTDFRVMNWGFPRVGRGAQDQKLAPTPTNNARDDKLHTDFWRESFEQRRCLIPLTQWAEPQGRNKRMTRTWHSLPGGEPFAVGGIWRNTDLWGNCYSMVMVEGSPQMAEVHDRMPVILHREQWETWLHAPPADAFALCKTWLGKLVIEQTNDRWVDGTPRPTYAEEIAELPLFGGQKS
ncbi:SOS response-associated peptidase [Novosphingobium terrae]|uniref:SOS response-associated peptidase n=1 Tax=Novosphingobium terrae TaxID=2726189 RepID=UPI002AC317ED|nr:SOS response-associated peptidase family protein [Novosphingobium terrae]